MKKLLAILALLVLIATACNQANQDAANIYVNTAEKSQQNPISEVRLLSEGFDSSELSINAGESITLFIVDNNVNGHYLAMNSHRISEKNLLEGDKINVPFQEAGIYVITDETSGSSVKINVQ